MTNQKDIELELCKSSFHFFVTFIFRNLLHKEFTWYNAHKRIAETFLDIGAGGRRILNVCPRIGKTTIAQCYMAWRLLKDPTCNFVYLSYDKDLAKDKCGESKNYVDFCSKYFGLEDLSLKHGQNSASRWMTNVGGYVFAKGTGTPVTGYGCDTMMIVDDPNKPMDRTSPAILKKRNMNWNATIKNRINSPDVPIVVIQQRVCEDDISGFLLKGGDGDKWSQTLMKGIDENGNALCPEMFSVESMLNYKNSDPFTFYAQIQQQPIEEIGNYFQRSKIVLSNSKPSLMGKRTIISVDASGKGDIANDPNAIAVITTDGVDYWVLEVHNFKSDITLLLTRLRELRRRYGDSVPILVEAKANGLACIQLLRKEMSGILETSPHTDKVERASMVKYLFDSNNVQFCCGGLVWGEVLQQFSSFPNVAHDDIVDSVVQGITWLRDNGNVMRSANARPIACTRRTYGAVNNNNSNPMRGY